MSVRRRSEHAGLAPVEASARRGTLFVVATPIGNLDDLSPRAVETLRRCRLVACEDTRVTRALLHRHQISTTVISCHRYNEMARTSRILATLAGGGDVALVTDGGTPGLSDPGAVVVRAARADAAPVVPIPGPSAVTALWSVSGFPPGPFTVFGFLPQRSGERRRALEALRHETRPLMFFESPHRILAMLADAIELLGDRACIVGREMTKVHEEFLTGPLSAVRRELEARTIRGEFALVVAPDPSAGQAGGNVDRSGDCAATTTPATDPERRTREAAAQVLRLVDEGMDRRMALRRVARATGVSRRDLYAQMVRDRAVGRAQGSSEEE